MIQNPEWFLQYNMYARKKRIQRKIISQFSVDRIADHFLNTGPQGGTAFLYKGIPKRCWMQNPFFYCEVFAGEVCEELSIQLL